MSFVASFCLFFLLPIICVTTLDVVLPLVSPLRNRPGIGSCDTCSPQSSFIAIVNQVFYVLTLELCRDKEPFFDLAFGPFNHNGFACDQHVT